MNKAQLADALAAETTPSKAAAGRAVDALFEVIVGAVVKNDNVMLVGFGTLKQSKRAARTGRNPPTGAEIKIKAKKMPRFTPGATFKEAVNGKGGKK